MNDEFNYEYNDFDELYESMMETNPEDWLPDAGIREEFDSETIAMLKNFWYDMMVRWGDDPKLLLTARQRSH